MFDLLISFSTRKFNFNPQFSQLKTKIARYISSSQNTSIESYIFYSQIPILHIRYDAFRSINVILPRTIRKNLPEENDKTKVVFDLRLLLSKDTASSWEGKKRALNRRTETGSDNNDLCTAYVTLRS